MVAGICEYGIIHPEDTFVPRIYLYSAKIHDGEYIGDFALCKQELDDEKIEINEKNRSGKAVASLTLGILSIVFSLFWYYYFD